MKSVLLSLFLVFGLQLATVHAEESKSSTTTLVQAVASPASTVSPAPEATPKIVAQFKKIDDAIPGDLAVWILAGLAVLAELLMRVFPTFKPKSLLLVVAAVFASLSSIFAKMSGLVDKVAQNIKSPAKEEPK